MHLHGAGGMRLTAAHDLLSRRHRVIVFEMPGFGQSAENNRTGSASELGATMGAAVGGSGHWEIQPDGQPRSARGPALWLALKQPDRVAAVVLEGSSAIRPAGHQPPSGTPAEIVRLIFAHPERLGAVPPTDPAISGQAARAGRTAARTRPRC